MYIIIVVKFVEGVYVLGFNLIIKIDVKPYYPN